MMVMVVMTDEVVLEVMVVMRLEVLVVCSDEVGGFGGDAMVVCSDEVGAWSLEVMVV